MGNNYRIKRVAKKAIDGEIVKIVYFGSSVTAGYIPEKGIVEKNYARLSFDYFSKKTKNDKCIYENYGLPASDVFTGLALVDKYLSSQPADVVFVEYALNNGSDDESISAYESLIRKLYSMDNKPAVVSVFLPNQDFSTSEDYMKKIAEHYDLQTVCVSDNLKSKIESKNMVWEDYASDYGHPNEDGHRFIASQINQLWDSVWKEKFDKELKEIPEAYFDDAYENYKFMSFSSLRDISMTGFRFFNKDELLGERITSTGESQSAVSFTTRFSSLYIIFESTNNINCGEMQIYIDNNYVENISGYSPSGRDDITCRLAYRGNSTAFHDVKILMKNKDGKQFINIIGIGVY